MVMWTQINLLLWVWVASREPGAPSAIAKGEPGCQAPWAVHGMGTGCCFPEVSQVGAAWHWLWLEESRCSLALAQPFVAAWVRKAIRMAPEKR